MTLVFKLLSVLALLLTLVPALLVFAGTLQLNQHYTLMLIGALLWFLSAPFWMLKKKQKE